MEGDLGRISELGTEGESRRRVIGKKYRRVRVKTIENKNRVRHNRRVTVESHILKKKNTEGTKGESRWRVTRK